MNSIPFYGKGLAFPMRLDATNARPAITSEELLVKASMEQILNTSIGERPFLTRNGVPYGTRIRLLMFESAEAAIDIITFDTKRALTVWEPRIVVTNVSCVEEPNFNGGSAILTHIGFFYRSNNRPDNYVTPFRLRRTT